MSSKSSRKPTTTVKIPASITVTKTKSVQQKRPVRNKEKITEKPKLAKPEIKSPKLNTSAIRSKNSLLKLQVTKSIGDTEQVEYYPNKLKRKLCPKKIMLKPKDNFKVIATTNKRKLATPQRGLKSPPPQKRQNSSRSLLKSPKQPKTRPCTSPELSVQDMVRIIEETRSLSDDDFMEILTCPSPVWWEDPPDARYIEGAIYSRIETSRTSNEAKTKLSTETTVLNKSDNHATNSKHKIGEAVLNSAKDERFDKKKQKLENVLGSIKNKTKKKPLNKKVVKKSKRVISIRKISESTEEDISDISFNEEEILKNLENMDIPLEKPQCEQSDHVKSEIDKLEMKTEIMNKDDIRKFPLLRVKNDMFLMKPIPNNIPDTNIKLISDIRSGRPTHFNIDKKFDEIVIVDSCTNSSLGFSEDSDPLKDCGPNLETVEQNLIKCEDRNSNLSGSKHVSLPNKKVVSDMTEYITVYKIIPEKKNDVTDCEDNSNSTDNKTKLDAKGKLNNFFKQCKSYKSLKKTENSILLTDVNENTTDNAKKNSEKKTEFEEEKNRLNHCDSCVIKTENGTDIPCEKCEILPCDTCNFLADTKEIYKKHVSSCKDVARISWSQNYLLNPT